jgi:hypothetical protein
MNRPLIGCFIGGPMHGAYIPLVKYKPLYKIDKQPETQFESYLKGARSTIQDAPITGSYITTTSLIRHPEKGSVLQFTDPSYLLYEWRGWND